MKSIGIIGGVGPEAGTLLQRYVIEETAAQKSVRTDQDHVPTFHLSVPHLIADRSAYLADQSGENPASGALKVAHMLDGLGANFDGVVVGVPCNTFHAPAIWDSFVGQSADLERLEVVNMIDSVAAYIKDSFIDVTKIGLMSTTGTRNAGIYHSALESEGFEILEVESQSELHETIYNSEYGLKAVSPPSAKAVANFESYADELIDKGAEALILGCTEIPLAFAGVDHYKGVPLIDPMRSLARALVAKALIE